MTRRLRLLLLQTIVPAGILVGYGLWSHQAGNFYFPPLGEILARFFDLWIFDRVGSDLAPSLARMLAGYGLSIVLGVGIGLALGMSRVLRTAAEPIVEFLRALPAPALIPFALLVLGAGDGSKVFVIVLGAIWPILLNSIDGVRSVDSQQVDMARSYQIPLPARILRVVLPAASPRIFAGMRTSLALALILMVVSEMVASSNGLGYFVLQSQRAFATPEMWTGIILLGVLGFLLNWVFLRIEERFLFWHRGVKGLLPERARARIGGSGPQDHAAQQPAHSEVTRA